MLHEEKGGDRAEGKHDPDIGAPPPKPMRVLVVEDDATSANALRIILTRRGYQVRVAGGIGEAMRSLTSTPDIILLDLMLPDGDGLELLERMGDLRASTRVIVTTAVSDPTHLLAARRQQPRAILQKPINLNELLRIIEG
jgi:DNA-binding response OmpR family regulator